MPAKPPPPGTVLAIPLEDGRDALTKALSTYWTDPVTGEQHEEPATREEARGLEPAVWSADHVQDRLLDHLEGRESTWVQAVRPR